MSFAGFIGHCKTVASHVWSGCSYAARGVQASWYYSGKGWQIGRRVFSSTPFRLLLIFALVFGTYNPWGHSAYSYIAHHVRILSQAWDASIGWAALSIAVVSLFLWVLLVWRGGSEKVRNRLFGSWLFAVVVGSLYVLAKFTDTDMFAIARIGLVVTIVAILWLFLIRFAVQMMGTWIFALTGVAIGCLTVVLFGAVLIPMGVQVSPKVVGLAAQSDIAVFLIVGVLFPRFRQWWTTVPSIITPERPATAVATGEHGSQTAADNDHQGHDAQSIGHSGHHG